MNKYTLGLDIGVTSIGWAAINQEEGKLIDFGVRMFNKANEAKTSRLNRSARRTLRRKKWRKNELLNAFGDFEIIKVEKDEHGHVDKIEGIEKKEYLNFYSKYNGLVTPCVDTIYHLRQKALNEKVSVRELIMCLYNILQARGHFLMEDIDFSHDGISFDIFKSYFYELIEKYKICDFKNKDVFENTILEKIYFGSFKASNIKKEFSKQSYTFEEDDEIALLNLCKLLCGYKADISTLISRDNDEKESLNIEDIKKDEQRSDIKEKIVSLYDITQIAQNLSCGCKYICDVDVKNYEEFKQIVSNEDFSKEEKTKLLQKFLNVSKSSKKEERNKNEKGNWYGRSIKNLSHSYPNGMYVKEAVDILKKQAEYNDKITVAFIEVISSIVSSRIPYYIGPLGENTKNGWAIKDVKYKYSYEYSKNPKSEFESIKRWKERMISHCSYLHDEYALPKGSFVGETFSILNELNNYSSEDLNNNDYYLTKEDKIKVFNEVFLLNSKVTFNDVAKCLNLSSYGNAKHTMNRFNNVYTLYFDIVKIIPELKIETIEELFDNKDKIDMLEKIILNINLFDEDYSKYSYFKETTEYSDEQCKTLSKLKSNNFYSLSYKFIMEEPMDIDGNSMMDILFEDNKETHKNNQMVIIQNACDSKGRFKDYIANKYEKILKQHNNELSYNLIMDNEKTIMPISRIVIRSLNEALKIYKSAIETFGVPNRVIIETASGNDAIKDFTENSGVPMKRYKANKNLLEYLNRQISEGKNNGVLDNRLDEWQEMESFFLSNETKIELYIRQDGIDLLTGKAIDITNLKSYEIDHILPRGFGDDSMDDKMLTLKLANAKKGDRLPIEFLESSDSRDFTNMTVAHYEDIVNSLFSMRLISDRKRDRLLLKNQNEVEQFINQDLVDTRYIIREFRSILNAYNKLNGYDTSIVNLRGAFTSVFRKQFGFRKNRDLGDQHHAYDAATLCLVDKVLNQYYPNYDKRGTISKYQEFVGMLDKNNTQTNDEASNDKLKNIIFAAFNKAYNQDLKKSSLIKQLKETTPLVSWKVEKNYHNKLFDATLYKPDENGMSVLSLLGVNNDKRSFSSVNSFAVDFYKINGKHYAIHIPYLIINENGVIIKEKYMTLIRDYYKADDLIDSNGNLITKAFRFRAYKNDLIYDTYSNEPVLFNIGSIVNKKLDFVYPKVFSYEIVDGAYCNSIMNEIIKHFHLKTSQNKNGILFRELDKKEVLDYLCDKCGIVSDKERYIKALIENSKDINNLKEFCMTISFLSIMSEKPYCPPTIIGQNCPVVNNKEIKKDVDAEWVKLKYHPLGVRFSKNEKGSIVIKGPVNKANGYKKIKRENYTWNVSKM